MEVNWGGVALYVGVLGAFVLGMTLWVIRMRRHPVTRMTPRMAAMVELTRRIHELAWSAIYAGAVFMAVWLFLSWLTHAVNTGHPLSILPHRSPWERMMFSYRLRPWNIVGIGAFLVALTVAFYRLNHWPWRVIDTALRRPSQTLGLSVVPNASVFVFDWRAKYLDGTSGIADLLNDRMHQEDFVFIANRCWALHRPGDESRILVVSHGSNLTSKRHNARIVVWICLYVRKDGHGRPLRSAEVKKRLGDEKFEVSDLSNCLRVSETRVCDKVGTRAVRDATAPERIAALWRAAETEPSA